MLMLEMHPFTLWIKLCQYFVVLMLIMVGIQTDALRCICAAIVSEEGGEGTERRPSFGQKWMDFLLRIEMHFSKMVMGFV